MDFARTRNAVPLRADAVPFVEIEVFRREVLQAIAAGGRLLLLTGLSQNNGETRLLAAIADDAQGEIALSSTIVSGAYRALTRWTAPRLIISSAEIHEQWGVDPQGHPWLKPVRFPPTGPTIGKADFFRVAGAEIHEVAVGPVHAGIIEPGHFRFNCHGEQVIHLEIRPDTSTAGSSGRCRVGRTGGTCISPKPLPETPRSATRQPIARSLEGLSGAACSPRARGWRALALELERIANHIGDLGALAGDVGFLPAAAYCGRLRGDALNMTALFCGSRLGRGWVRPGGIALDPAAETLREFKRRMQDAERDMRNAVDLLWKSSSVRGRFEHIGILTRQAAADLGVVGPAARASGIDRDARRDFSAPLYSERLPSIAVGDAGDVFARAQQRWREIENSIAFIGQALDEPAGGAAQSALDGTIAPNAVIASIVEGWRGEILHLALTISAGRFARYKIVDPSFHNWFALATAMRGQAIMDFPLCNKSFNLSYCGHDL